MKDENPGQARLRVLKKYAAFARRKGYHPSRSELQKQGVSRDQIRRHFGTQERLQAAAKEYAPKVFENIIDESLFTRKRFQSLRVEAGKFQRYFVTSAIVGKKVHEGFFESIQTFCKKKNAMLLVLPCADPASEGGWLLDPVLIDQHIVFDDLQLNDNIFISAIKLSAKHIDPAPGLGRIGQRNGSFIFASPKQRLKLTPTSNIKLPHAIMTTGALTVSKYSTTRYLSERTAYIADHDHVLGGLIVEIEDDKIFHYRQVQADRNGHFVDLGTFYRGKKVEALRPEALVLGDWHSGETDPAARKCFLTDANSLLAVTKAKRLVVHDGFNGRSISHHEEKNRILRAKRSAENQLDLQSELAQYAADLDMMTELPGVEEVIVVMSNHDEFLHRYLQEGRFQEDPKNYLIALKLAATMIEGKDNPVRTAVEWIGLKHPEKITWLGRDEDRKIAGIEVGAHGDKGANGSRGSLQAMEKAYGQSVSGHTHTPEILRGAFSTGTCSYLKLNYNVGPSSWMLTSCDVYSNGMRQLINIIEGKWKLEG